MSDKRQSSRELEPETHRGSHPRKRSSRRSRSRSRSRSWSSSSRSRSRWPRSRTQSGSRRSGQNMSSSGESDIAKLATVLAKFAKSGSVKHNRYINEKVIPEFNPENKDLSVVEWLDKINTYAIMYDWDDSHKYYLASLQLKGLAKLWYDGLKNPIVSWEAFGIALLKQFSGEENFGKLYELAGAYKSVPGQSLSVYCFEKIKRINRLNLDIPERKIVEFVVHGIHDEHIRMSLIAANKSTIAGLTQCLDTFPVEKVKDKNVKDNNTKYKEMSNRTSFRNRSQRFDSKACYNCGKEGHRKSNCPSLDKGKNDLSSENDNQKNTKNMKIKCNFCHKIGHIESNCFKKRDKEKGSDVQGARGKNSMQVEEVEFFQVKSKVNKPEKKCLVEKEERICSIDLGSECSLVRESVAHQLGLKFKQTNKTLSAFNHTIVVPLARSSIKVCIDNIPFKIKVFIVSDTQLTKEILIGRDIFNKAGVQANFNAMGVTFSIIESNEQKDVLEIEKVDFGKIRSIEQNNIFIEELSTNDIERLLKLLNNYRQTVSLSLKELGQTTAGVMKIELISDTPIYHRPYRLSLADREKVKDMIKELEECGIIRESTSPFGSPVVLVKKKNGETRMAIDYRGINKITKKIKYPLPLIDDQIDQLGNKRVFTSLDLKSGFYQIAMHEDSIEKTAFVTPDGQWEFLRMPFGLVNAPAVFQKTINNVLKGNALVYIGDILIASESINEGLKQLENILELLKASNLTLNLSKCKFFQSKLDYLGREISIEGVRPGEYKPNAVMNVADPIDVRQVRQFLGLAGYFRKFIKDFAKKVTPLTNLLRKAVPWRWGVVESRAVQEIKTILSTRPVLAIYDPNCETEVHTDASAVGLGAILLQKQDGEKKVIAYYSCKTTPEQQNYHSYDLETLAVVAAFKTFRVYLLGIKFTLVTDCSALRATMTKKDILPRVARWWVYLQDFNFEIVYRPGKQVAHVDYLSRNPVECLSVEITEKEWIKVAQLQDPQIENIRKILESGIEHPSTKQYNDLYVLKGGVVFRKTKTGLRWVVPKMSRFNIVRLCHDEQGHFALERTLEKIRKNYYFKGMRKFVTKYINACLNCLYFKSSGNRKPGFLHPIEKIAIPFHTIHIDHVGPFIKSKRKNTHILTIVDGFTKYCVLEPVRDTAVKGVLKALCQLFAIFGVPTRMISDRGSAFTSHRFRMFCEEYNIKHILNAVATPRANGQCERMNRIVLNSLSTTCAGQAEQLWDESVKKVQSGINSTMNRTTRMTPSQLLLGYKPRSMADANLLESIQSVLDQVDLRIVRDDAKLAIDAEQEKQKKQFDHRRFKAVVYSVGDVVMVTTNPVATGESKKLVTKTKGPFRVTAVLPNDRYEVQDLRDLKKSPNSRSIVAVDSLRRCVTFDATK